MKVNQKQLLTPVETIKKQNFSLINKQKLLQVGGGEEMTKSSFTYRTWLNLLITKGFKNRMTNYIQTLHYMKTGLKYIACRILKHSECQDRNIHQDKHICCLFSIISTPFTETSFTLHPNFSKADAVYWNENLNDYFQIEKCTNFYYQLVLNGRIILI